MRTTSAARTPIEMLAPSSLMKDFLGMDNDGRVLSLRRIGEVFTLAPGGRGPAQRTQNGIGPHRECRVRSRPAYGLSAPPRTAQHSKENRDEQRPGIHDIGHAAWTSRSSS